MKITKENLRRIIKEELKAVLREEGEEEAPSLTDEDWKTIEEFIETGDESYFNQALFFADAGGPPAINKTAAMIYRKDSSNIFYLLEQSEEYGDFNLFPRITYLDLSNKGLTEIPESIGKLEKLERLHLNDNKLSSLPESIGNLVRLYELTLNNNQLSSLPESIGNLTSLYDLKLRNNRFSDASSLPNSIGNLTQLSSIELRGNPIQSSLGEKIKKLLPNTRAFV